VTIGRILMNDQDRGAGFVLFPGVVVTANNVVRGGDAATLTFARLDGSKFQVVELEGDENLNVAVLRLAEAVPSQLRVGRATQGAAWGVEAQPRGNDPALTGTIDITDKWVVNSKGHTVEMMQLRVEQELLNYEGYAGAPVILQSSRQPVVGVLAEQLNERQASRPGQPQSATNVLYAIPIQKVLNRFALAERDIPRPRQRDQQDTSKPERDQIEWLSDSPARRDLLGRKALAHALAVRLQRLHKEEPEASFLVHIDGPWGAGKSTLLNFLRDELEREWLVVGFDAWRQSNIGPAWWALLTALRHDLSRSLRWSGRLRLGLAEGWHRIRRAGAPYLLAVFVLLVGATGLFLLLRPHQLSSKALGDIVKTLTAIITATGILWAGALVASRFLLWNSAGGARLFEQSNTNPMQEVADHFAWLVKRVKKPIAFFIDDLDRCNERYVVELLDAVQTLLRDAPKRVLREDMTGFETYFIVAADGAWIRNSYEASYGTFANSIAEPGRPLGYLFLDKLFQLTVSVPSLSRHAQDAYLQALLRTTSDIDKQAIEIEADVIRQRVKASVNEAEVVEALQQASPAVRHMVADTAVDRLTAPLVQATTEHALQRFATLLDPNPRSMKRFLNAYSMTRNVRTLEGNPVPIEALALWTILHIRWPSLADYLRRHSEGIDWVGNSDQYVDLIPESLYPLFDMPELTRLVAFAVDNPLTPEQIRACCGSADALDLPAESGHEQE
jgi:KAP family P-loop domain